MAKQYSQLFIDFTASYETYQKVTDVLGVTPQPHDSNEIPDTSQIYAHAPPKVPVTEL